MSEKKLILAIETSCDETAAAVYDSQAGTILSSCLHSQIELHRLYGGVIPELASRSQLEKIDPIVHQALCQAEVTLDEIETIAVTNRPGLAGSLLVGLSFAKALAWGKKKKLIGIDHTIGHIFSSYLTESGNFLQKLKFPYICLSLSGGHTTLYLVKDFLTVIVIGATIDDAAGEMFDKVGKMLNLGYPGGPVIETLAKEVGFEDFYDFPRVPRLAKSLNFSFSGLKTAILYKAIKFGYYDQEKSCQTSLLTLRVQQEFSSSVLVCVKDILLAKLALAFAMYPEASGCAFVGGVAANAFLKEKLFQFCLEHNKDFVACPRKYSTDNAAMIACAASFFEKKENSTSNWFLDIGGKYNPL